MGLMTGTGPFGLHPAGEFNFEPPPPGRALYLEPTPKRVRVVVGDEVIADSRRAMLLHESGSQPVYYFPPEDVREDVLEPSDTSTHCPKKGDVLRSSHQVRVLRKGTVLAESERALVMFETGLPPRFYLPREDVVAELRPSERATGCPVKGVASYFSVALDGHVIEDIVWTYPDPLPEATRIAGLLAFYNERVDIELDGIPQERPEPPWRPDAAASRT